MARRYVRDARGRFAPKGYSGQTGGTGSRLGAPGKAQKPGKQIKAQSAGGKLRKPPEVGKPTVKAPTIKNPTVKKPAAAGNANKISPSPRRLTKDEQIAKDVMTNKKFRSDKQRKAEMVRRGVDPNTDFTALVAGARAKQGGNLKGTNARVSTTGQGKTFGPRNTIKEGPKSPQTKMNKAVDDIAGAIKDMKPQMDKLKKVRKEADALKKKIVDGMRGDAEKAYKKPSVTDKRSRDYFGKLTKEGKGQDASTGGKKKRNRKPKK